MEGSSIEGDSGWQWLVLLLSIPSSVYPILFGILVLLFFSALISGSEVSFFSLTPSQLSKLHDSEDRSDRRIAELLARPKELLASILILNNLVNVAIVTMATYVSWEVAGRSNELAILLLTIIVTIAIVFFGEIVPKVIATQRNLSFARFTSLMLYISTSLLRPFAVLLIGLSGAVERRFKRKIWHVSVNELNEAVEIAAVHEATHEEKEILKGIVSFGTKTVRQVMQSRIDITALDIELDFHDLMDRVNKSGYSRIPIYEDTIDHIKGVLYIKDLLPFIDRDERFRWQELIRTDTFFVPEFKKISDLLKDFQSRRVHMAIVVDEYGGTSGLITMEDVIEEIIGEINDEFDSTELIYKKVDNATYTFEGKTSLNDFCKIIGEDPEIFADAKGDSESLGGLLLELFAKMPNAGEQIEFGNFVFTIVSVNRKRIKSIRVLLKNSSSNGHPTDGPSAEKQS